VAAEWQTKAHNAIQPDVITFKTQTVRGYPFMASLVAFADGWRLLNRNNVHDGTISTTVAWRYWAL
jgi:hypothetical protein